MVSLRQLVAFAALLFNSGATSFFSFTNLLYRIHWCEHPTPGPLGCGPPVCPKAPLLPQCHDEDGGHSGSSGGSGSGGGSRSGSGGSSGSSSKSGSGGSSGSSSKSGSGGSSSSGSGSSGSSSGSGSSGSSSSSGSSGSGNRASSSSSSSGYIDYGDITSLCHRYGGCNGIYSSYCDEEGDCEYIECDSASYSSDCIYTCDEWGHCYQICDDGDDCGSAFMDYYKYNEESTANVNMQSSQSRWTSGTYIALLLLLVASLAFAVHVAVSRNAENKNSNGNHPLKGSLGKRMKLFDRLAPAPKNPGPRDADLSYQRTKDDGTATIPAQTV